MGSVLWTWHLNKKGIAARRSGFCVTKSLLPESCLKLDRQTFRACELSRMYASFWSLSDFGVFWHWIDSQVPGYHPIWQIQQRTRSIFSQTTIPSRWMLRQPRVLRWVYDHWAERSTYLIYQSILYAFHRYETDFIWHEPPQWSHGRIYKRFKKEGRTFSRFLWATNNTEICGMPCSTYRWSLPNYPGEPSKVSLNQRNLLTSNSSKLITSGLDLLFHLM